VLLSGAAEHSIPTCRADIVQSIFELGLHCKHDIHAVGQAVVRKAEKQSLMAAYRVMMMMLVVGRLD